MVSKQRSSVLPKKSLTLNAFLNMVKTGLLIAFQLITFPYASRILSTNNLGKVDYAYSISTYFALFAQLGVVQYAVREGAKIRNDKLKMRQFTSEIFTLNLLSSSISFLLLVLSALAVPKFQDHTLLIVIYGFSFVCTTLGIEWMNTIYEDFLYITIRSIIIYAISLVSIFVFVRKPEDYVIYTILIVLPNFFVCISNLFYCRKYVHFGITLKKSVFRHLKPILVFFSNTLAISIYISADSTMIGWMIGTYYNGIYAVAVKVYSTVKTILGALYAVTIPRLTRAVDKNNMDEYRTILTDICSAITLLIFPAAAGLIALGREVVLVVAGNEYVDGTRSLQILAVALIFAVWAGILVNCINIPTGREKISLRATIISAIANIVLNLYFIPNFHQNGAAITTLISEILVCVICIVSLDGLSKYLDLKKLAGQLPYALGGALWIILSGFVVKQMSFTLLPTLVIVMGIGGIGYAGILILGRNKYALRYMGKLTHRKNNG